MCKATDLLAELTPEEKTSLRELCRGDIRARIVWPHAEKLIRLGLAELSFGRLALTFLGRRAVAIRV